MSIARHTLPGRLAAGLAAILAGCTLLADAGVHAGTGTLSVASREVLPL